MDPATDPNDFSDDFRLVRLLDSSVRCSICCNIFDTPLLLRLCGHSFCSPCIRQNLEYQERNGNPACPNCRQPCDARDLAPNVALRDVIDRYTSSRPLLLHLQQSTQRQAQQQQQQQQQQGEEVDPRRSARRSKAAAAKQPGPMRHPHSTAADLDASAAAQPSTSPAGVSTRRKRKAVPNGHSSGDAPEVDVVLALSADDQDASSSSDNDESVDLVSSDGEEWGDDDSPSPPLAKRPKKKQPPPQQQLGSRRRSNGEPAPAKLNHTSKRSSKAGTSTQPGQQPAAAPVLNTEPKGFVRCPLCNKSVPQFYINSHVDQCLVSGPSSAPIPPKGKQRQPDTAAAPGVSKESHPTQHAQQEHLPDQTLVKGFQPLAVPPKLVPTLVTEKSMRPTLKKYFLPTDGKKAEMLDRYNRFRLAVETANDKGEASSYERLARQVSASQRQRAAAHLLAPTAGAAGHGASNHVNGPSTTHQEQPHQQQHVDGLDAHSCEDPGMALMGASFEELIAATRVRDAARKRARLAQQAATVQDPPVAAEGEQTDANQDKPSQQQQEEEQEEEGNVSGWANSTPTGPPQLSEFAAPPLVDQQQQQQQEQDHPNPSPPASLPPSSSCHVAGSQSQPEQRAPGPSHAEELQSVRDLILAGANVLGDSEDEM